MDNMDLKKKASFELDDEQMNKVAGGEGEIKMVLCPYCGRIQPSYPVEWRKKCVACNETFSV